jgi:hypothetical protein
MHSAEFATGLITQNFDFPDEETVVLADGVVVFPHSLFITIRRWI